jgi:hypothetical protein
VATRKDNDGRDDDGRDDQEPDRQVRDEDCRSASPVVVGKDAINEPNPAAMRKILRKIVAGHLKNASVGAKFRADGAAFRRGFRRIG